MIAAHDCLFFQHNPHLVGPTKRLNKLGKVLRLRSALSNRLQDLSGNHALRKNRGLFKDQLGGESYCEKLIANLEHILRSLHQTALEAVIYHYFKVAEVHILHWHLHWQHSKRIGEEWFAEWPSGHRPLSTTWPWNIKTSLLVLWGVCWMFYGPSGNNNRRPTSNPRGAAESDQLSEDLRTGHLDSQSQPNAIQSIYSRQQRFDLFINDVWIDTPEVWAGPALNTHLNHSWLHPTQAGVARGANNCSESHEVMGSGAYD